MTINQSYFLRGVSNKQLLQGPHRKEQLKGKSGYRNDGLSALLVVA